MCLDPFQSDLEMSGGFPHQGSTSSSCPPSSPSPFKPRYSDRFISTRAGNKWSFFPTSPPPAKNTQTSECHLPKLIFFKSHAQHYLFTCVRRDPSHQKPQERRRKKL